MKKITELRLIGVLIFVAGILGIVAGVDGILRLPYFTPFTALSALAIFLFSFTLIGIGLASIINPTILNATYKHKERTAE